MTALGEKGPQLTDLVSNTNTALGAIAVENQSLAEALDLLPQTLRRGSTTFVNLRAALVDLTSWSTRRSLRRRTSRPSSTICGAAARRRADGVQLKNLINTPGAHNDFTDLMEDAPELASRSPGRRSRTRSRR